MVELRGEIQAAVFPTNRDNCTNMLATRKLIAIFSILAAGATVARFSH